MRQLLYLSSYFYIFVNCSFNRLLKSLIIRDPTDNIRRNKSPTTKFHRKAKRKKRKQERNERQCSIENGTIVNFGIQYFVTCNQQFCLESDSSGSFQCTEGNLQDWFQTNNYN